MAFVESLEGRRLLSVAAPAAEAADRPETASLSVPAQRPRRAAAAPATLLGDWSGRYFNFRDSEASSSIAAHVPVQRGKRFEIWLYFDISAVPSSHINPGNDAICIGTVNQRGASLKGKGWIGFERIRISARGKFPRTWDGMNTGVIEGRYTLVVHGRKSSGEFWLSKTPATAS